MAKAAAAKKQPAKKAPAKKNSASEVGASSSNGSSGVSASNVINDPAQSLQTFNLLDLQQYTQEKVYATLASRDFHLFYVGRDDVHDILKHVLSRVSVSLYLNMFGYDDPELNDILMRIARDETVTMLVTLDRSQANGAHEKLLLDADRTENLAAFNTHVVIGESLSHQISHTKGFVADGKVAGEGSTNWSQSGEGTAVNGVFNVTAKGYKAQNNTQSIITDPDTVSRFSSELVAEHVTAQKQAAAVANTPLQAKVAEPPSVAKAVPPHPGLVHRRSH
jgi:hypothetical protein